MDDIQYAFGKVFGFMCFLGVIIWVICVISSTPAQCWLSFAPITCARTIEIQEQLERI